MPASVQKIRPFFGVSVPASPLADERALRTFLEHLCDALTGINGAINPGGAAAPLPGGTAALYQPRQVFFGSDDGTRLQQDSQFTYNHGTGGLTVPRLGLTGTTGGAAALGPLLFQTTGAALQTTPIAGTVECDGGHLYYTDTTPTRHRIAFDDTQYWGRSSASGTLYPNTITDIVSIGSSASPYNSYDLGLWHAGGLAHCYVTAAAGTGASTWVPVASLGAGAPTDLANGASVWRVGTETSHCLYLSINGTDYVGIARDTTPGGGAGAGSIIPLNANMSLGAFSGSAVTNGRFHSLHLQSASPNQGITYGSGSTTHAYLYHDATDYYLRAAAGSLRLRVDATAPARIAMYTGTSKLAHFYYHSTGPVRRWNPGTDDSTDLGGAAGTADNERWRNLYLTGGVSIRTTGGAATAGTATLTAGAVTISTTAVTASSLVYLSRKGANGSTAFGLLTYTVSAGTSITVTSKQAASPATTETNDTSTFDWLIVEPN